MNFNKEPDHYCLLTVTFGDRPSDIIAITALHKTAEMLKSEYPETAAMLINDLYVDDVIHSCETISEALRKITATDKILKAGRRLSNEPVGDIWGSYVRKCKSHGC